MLDALPPSSGPFVGLDVITSPPPVDNVVLGIDGCSISEVDDDVPDPLLLKVGLLLLDDNDDDDVGSPAGGVLEPLLGFVVLDPVLLGFPVFPVLDVL